MWRLWHRLFNWQYVYINYSGRYFLRRIKYDGDGNPFVMVQKSIMKLTSDLYTDWIPITCTYEQSMKRRLE